jgi:hypothetical protein
MNTTECCTEIVFNSENGNSIFIPVTLIEGAPPLQTFNQTIASVSINTCRLNHPKILIEFSGTLNVTPTTSAISTLVFTLFRSCRGTDVREPLTTFNFYLTDVVSAITTSQTLVFKYISKDSCRECCSYDLELTSITTLELGTTTYSINDGVIIALAKDS